MSYTLTLPMPVSSNRYWRTAARGKKVVTYLSKEALEFKREVLRIAEAAGVTDPIRGRVHIDMKLYPHRPKDWLKRARVDPLTWDDTVQRIDLDNACKAVQNAFEEVEGLYGVSLGRAVAKIGIGYDTVTGMRAARGEVPWGVQRKLAREKACEAALASLLRGVSQEKACADAGVSVQHFRPWRAARGVVPSQGELRRLRDLSKA